MNINLNKLIIEANKRFVDTNNNLITIELCNDMDLRVSMGDTVYFCNYEKLIQILSINKVNLKIEKDIYDVLSKHLTNQLSAYLGKKVHPEVLSESSDII